MLQIVDSPVGVLRRGPPEARARLLGGLTGEHAVVRHAAGDRAHHVERVERWDPRAPFRGAVQPGVRQVQALAGGANRELEQEADDRAVGIMIASSYDAHALPEIYDILAQDYEGIRPRVPTIWSTHPQLEARAARTREQTANAPAGQRDAALFDAVVLPIRIMTIRDYIQDDYPRTAIALADELAVRYAEQPEFLLLLGDAWAAMGPRSEFDEDDLSNGDRRRNATRRITRTRQERDAALLETPEGQAALVANLAKARDAYQRTAALEATFAPAYRGLGEVAERLGEPRAAAQAYVDYLQRAPQAGDRTVIVQRLRDLREQLRTEETGDASNTR